MSRLKVGGPPLRLIRLKPRSTAALLVASLVGMLAFGWPLFFHTSQAGESAIGHTTDAPWLFVLLLPLLVAVVLAELSESGIDAKVIALVGMLAAVGAGAFPDLPAAVAATLTRAPLDVPDAGAHEEYAQPYARFRASFPAARPDLLSHG